MYDRQDVGVIAGREKEAAQALSLQPERAAGSDPDEKAIVRTLFDGLEAQGVRYCHWKSNVRLRDTLAGRTDIDILVDPRDGEAFLQVLLNTGFRLTQAGIGNGHPGVFHALGLDDATAELCDLHAYFRIVSGDSIVKSYRLPVEKALLEQCRHLHGVRVPVPAAELAIFVLRIILKHASAVEARKCGRYCDQVVSELAWLLEQCRREDAAALCIGWFPAIDRPLFDEMIDAVGDPGAVARRKMLGRRLARRLRPLRRLSGSAIQLSRLVRLYAVLQKRLSGRRSLSPLTGGTIVALVGPKGTGKSTLATEIAARLGRYLAVRPIHAGKPPMSPLSWAPLRLKPFLRSLMPGERLRARRKPERRESGVSLVHVVRRLLIAHDRRRLLHSAARAAASGCIIISDRYPSAIPGAADSSEFDAVAIKTTASPLVRRLMDRELSIYRALPAPDVVLRLSAPLETAVARDAGRNKPKGPDPDAVRGRWVSENLAEFPGAKLVQIDTGGPLDETVRSAVRAVWRAL